MMCENEVDIIGLVFIMVCRIILFSDLFMYFCGIFENKRNDICTELTPAESSALKMQVRK